MHKLITILLVVILVLSLVLNCDSLNTKGSLKFYRTKSSRHRFSALKVSLTSCDIQEFIRLLLEECTRDKIMFSSTAKYGGHITFEYFEYIDRDIESEFIASLFDQRRNGRKESKNPKDKKWNPLIALPGSPGSGKSTFMAHFPQHKSYRKYVEDSDLVLVSTLTFNSAMNYGTTAFGLRIIYGLLKSMGMLEHYASLQDWSIFYNKFISYNSLTGYDGVKMIDDLLLELDPNIKTRYLILVDELVKCTGIDGKDVSNEPKMVMKDIGRILDNLGNVDVIVSSLSPYFIESLLTDMFISQRKIIYVIPQPLIGVPIGTDKYDSWVSKICAQSKIPYDEVDEIQIKIMKYFYLLYSGHPRSLEAFCEICTTRDMDWSLISNSLISKTNTNRNDTYHVAFLNSIIDATRKKRLKPITYDVSDSNYISRYILSTKPVPSNDMISQQLIERNQLMLYKVDSGGFIFMTQTEALLKWFDRTICDHFDSMKLQMVQLLYKRFRFLSIAELWEYVIGITVVCHSYDNDKLQKIFGWPEYTGTFYDYPNFNVRYDKNTTALYENATKCNTHDIDPKILESMIAYNTLHVPQSRQKGFDLRVIMKDINRMDIHHLYIQCKVGQPKERLSKILASVIFYCVRHFNDIAKGTDLKELYIGLYIWADLDDATRASLTPESVREELKEFMTEDVQDDHFDAMRRMGIDENTLNALKLEMIKMAEDFVQDYWNHIFISDKQMIKDWLLPSFLSIPELVKTMN